MEVVTFIFVIIGLYAAFYVFFKTLKFKDSSSIRKTELYNEIQNKYQESLKHNNKKISPAKSSKKTTISRKNIDNKKNIRVRFLNILNQKIVEKNKPIEDSNNDDYNDLFTEKIELKIDGLD